MSAGCGPGSGGGGVISALGSSGGGGSGTVTSVSVATADGFAGTVASPTTTPAITVETTVTGIMKGNGTSASAAVAGTDYLTPSGSGAALTGITASQVGALPIAGGTMTGQETLAAGTTSLAPLTFQSGTNLTTATAGVFEFDGTVFYQTAVASSRQVADTEQFQILTATYTLANNTSPQPLLNATAAGAITVQASTGYFFECEIYGTTFTASSHQVAFSFGGTATPSNVLYTAVSDTTSGGTGTLAVGTAATAVNLIAASTNTFFISIIRGSMRFAAASGGTLIPQITQVTASGTPVLQPGTHFRIWPMGSNAVTNVGDWS